MDSPIHKTGGLSNLVAALQVFLKYGDPGWPTCCEHDILHICVNPQNVSQEDIKTLDVLGFIAHYDDGDFISYRFGSA
jgi:hypothetical protein